MEEETKEVKHLWQEYRAAVASPRADGFVRWAQRFTRAMPAIPLRAHMKTQVTVFLSDLAQQTHVESWSVDQAQESRRVLYQECLPLPWTRP